VKRRKLMLLLGGAMTAPRTLRTQQKATPVIGYLNSRSPEFENIPARLIAFRRGLNETGYVEGQNVAIDTVGHTANTIDCRPWQLIWLLVR
jgi:putative ABC transport system substrate-binding protein